MKLRLGRIQQEVYRGDKLLGSVRFDRGALYFAPADYKALKKSEAIAINKLLRAWREEIEREIAEARRDK